MLDQKDKEFLKELFSPVIFDLCEIKGDMKDVKQRLSVVEADVAELKTDVAELKTDVAELKTDVAELKADMKDVKQRLSIVETDVAELKTDVAELKTDMVYVKERLHRTNLLLENDISQRIGFLADGHKDLNRRLNAIIKSVEEHNLLVTRVSVLEGDFKHFREKFASVM